MEIKPKISVVTITRNGGTFIAKAIESVLAQSYSSWELIILDDDSTDETEVIANSFASKDVKIRYYKNSPALGISKSRNQGLSLAKGKYIAVLDSDDEWIDKDKLQKQFDFLENNPDYVLIGSNIKIVDNVNNFIKNKISGFFNKAIKNETLAIEDVDIRRKILIANQIPHSTVLYRKGSANKIGGYDKVNPYAEDLDLFLRLGMLGKMKNLKEATVSYMRHPEAATQKKKVAIARSHFEIIYRNYGKYPNWLIAIIFAKLRILKDLF